MQAKILQFPQRPGIEVKRHRRKRCPDECLELPPPPTLYEADPVMVADIEETVRKFTESFERYRDKIPTAWFNIMATMTTSSFIQSTIKDANKRLLKDAEVQETQIRMGLKLVKR